MSLVHARKAGAAALLALGACSEGEEVVVPEPLPVAVVTARYQDAYGRERVFAGRIDAAQASDLSFEVGGRIAAVLVDVGDDVAVGEVLAELDAERLHLRWEEAAAAEAEARAAAVRAEATLDRVRALLADGHATAQERDDALAERDGARERVARLAKATAQARRDEADAALTAPFAGTIAARLADEGRTVQAGAPVLTIEQGGAVEASIGVPTEVADRLSVGDRHRVVVASEPLAGTVVGVGETVDPVTRTRTIRLRLPGGARVAPGSLARLRLATTEEGRGAWVPMGALTEGYRGLWSVYVVLPGEGSERIARRDVEVVSLGEERAFVTGTLEDGDRVVRSAPFRFVPDQRVRVVKRAETEGAASAPGASAGR